VRAAVIAADGTFRTAEVPDPELLEDQVLVAVAACGVCGSDLHMRRSGLIFPGMVMGHEVAGTVVGTGPAVRGVEVGSTVAVMPYVPCGLCRSCVRGLPELCSDQLRTTIGLGPRPGGFAELMAVWPEQLHLLPPGIKTVVGALAEPLAVAMHAIDRSRINRGEAALVLGGGAIGIMTAIGLRAHGVDDCPVSEPSAQRRETLERLGFDALAPRELEIRSGGLPDVVFDTTGVGAALSTAVDLVRPGGTVMLMGLEEKPTEIRPARWLLKQVDVRAALAYGDSFPRAVAALGRLDLGPLCGARVGLDGVGDAFDRLDSGDAPPKILVEPVLR